MRREDNRSQLRVDDVRDSLPIVFGPFTLDRSGGELRRGDVLIPLRPLATRALLLLLEHPGRLVQREDLRRALWGDTAVEWEAGVHQVISQVRNALEDDPREPVFVETVARRGYRFTAQVIPADASTRTRPPRRTRWLYACAFVGGAASAVGIIVGFFALCCGLFA